MTLFDYTYSISEDFPNSKIDIPRLTNEIRESEITVALSHIETEEDDCNVWFKDRLSSAEETTLSSGIVYVHSGEPLVVEKVADVKIKEVESDAVLNAALTGPHDRSGKIRVHQTSRKLGTRIMWTGIGDDPSDPTQVGNGEKISFNYKIDQTEPLIKYIDFNIVENETWIHEGYLTWRDGQVDTLTLQMVPRVTEVVPTVSGSYDLYGGYMVIPAAPGQGSYEIVSDITTHSGGLVYMPNNDLDEPPTAFWNADWNSSTQRYENITPAPYGNGRYNMFTVEVIFAEFVREIPLLADGFIALNSSDTDQMGHGMRLKMIADTNKETAQDHNWAIACIMCLHRERSV